MKNVSIVIVSYNTKQDLSNCLGSIYKHTKNVDFEVIVVDNNSHDGSTTMITKKFPQVKLIKSGKNIGFGRANNLGASKAKGKYLLFLNPDTILSSNLIKQSYQIAERTDRLGAFSIRLLFADKTIQPSGGYFPNLIRLFSWHTAIDELPIINKLIKPIHPPVNFYQKTFEQDWITGAFMFTPKKVFTDLKGFDENIFMYGEDLELCYRLKKNGFKIVYFSSPSITHLQSKSSSSKFAILSEIKGVKYFFKKHKPPWQQPLVNLIFKLGSLLRLLLFGIILGDVSKKEIYQEALKY